MQLRSKQKNTIGKHILIVDDEKDLLEILKDILLSEGCSVETENRAGFAENTIYKKKFDLIIVDLRMPIVDGVTLIRHIKKSQINRDSKIAVLSGHVVSTALQTLLSLGVKNILTKPVKQEELISKINAIFDS